MQWRSLFIALAVFGLLLCQRAALAEDQEKQPEPAKAVAGLPADWSKDVDLPTEIPAPNGRTFKQPASKLKLWAEQGWLVAQFESKRGLEWKIVLAQAKNPVPPLVKVSGFGFEVTYGPYWIREDIGHLRIWREVKTAESPAWPGVPLEKDAKTTLLNTIGKIVRAYWLEGEWNWLGVGLQDRATGIERYDIWVRLRHRDLPKLPGQAISAVGASDVEDFTYFDLTGHLEPDLFTIRRNMETAASVARMLEKAKTKASPDSIVEKDAPKIFAETWLNVPEGTDGADAMKDKPALVVFWSSRDEGAGQLIWDCEQLYRKFKDRGFAVVGLRPQRDREQAAALIKERDVSFPIGSDSNRAQGLASMGNAQNFKARFSPACFLIDKSGKVVWGNSKTAPTAEQIEALLK
jgi:peroxiredoxin